jgi:hypothetical protein
MGNMFFVNPWSVFLLPYKRHHSTEWYLYALKYGQMLLKKLAKYLLFGSALDIFSIKWGIAQGLKMKIDPRNRSLRILGLDEYEVFPVYKKYAPLTNIYIDLGSSDGYYPLIYRKLNPQGNIYSFDSNPVLLNEQPANFTLNGFDIDNLHLFNKFVSDESHNNHISLDEVIEVKQQQIFIKIDIEGAEWKALNGMRNLLTSNNCILLIETHSKELEENCLFFLGLLNFECVIIRKGWWRWLFPEKRVLPHNRWFLAKKRVEIK